MKKKFVRTDVTRYSKIGKNRKKLQVWRRPRGRDNKIREHRFGYPVMPTVGYKKARKETGRIEGLVPVNVYNLKDVEKATKENIIIIGKVGAKKKIELIKKATELNIKIQNVARQKK